MKHLNLRPIFMLLLGMNLCLCSWAKNIVWEQPYASFYSGDLDITRVEFRPDETVVTLSWLGQGDIRMDSKTYLRVDTMKYMIREHPDTPLNEWIDATTKPAIFHFDPLPANTRQFAFIEDVERGFRLNAVVNLADTVLDLMPSDWRNDATGDWLLSLLPEKAIYDSHVWDYADFKKDSLGITFRLSCGDESHTLHIGNEKKLHRQISIDGGKPITCSRIVKHFLPDYPTKDLRTSFVDTGYMPDTAVVRGWLFGMNKKKWNISKEFEMTIENIFTMESEKFSVKMDSLGCFEMKVRLYGASEAYVDWKRSSLHLVFEPGKEYFVYVNFLTGQKLLMGEDCRLQNELLRYSDYTHGTLSDPHSSKRGQMPRLGFPSERSTQYMDTLRMELAQIQQNLQNFALQHPNISTRYKLFIDGYYRSLVARNLGQFSFNVENRNLSQPVREYLISEYLTKLPRPYTLYRDLGTAIRDTRMVYKYPYYNTTGIHAEKLGYIQLSDQERTIIQLKDSIIKECQRMFSLRVSRDSIQRWTEQTEWAVKAETEFDSLMATERGETINKSTEQCEKDIPTRVLNWMKLPNDMRDLCAAMDFQATAQRNSSVYKDSTYEHLLDSLHLPAARQHIQALHDKYVALEKQKTYAIRNASDVKGMTDGETILSKLIEPYRGRCIVLDVWGTWCAPCRQALKESKSEFEKLDPLNVVYLYLANRSEQKAWEAFIKENNLTGPNCVHYNLPEDQQSAIENFLNVSSFPSYFLIDPEGHVLEKKIDAREHGINELVNLIKELNAKAGNNQRVAQ